MEKQKPQVRDLRNGDWYWSNKLILDHPYLTPANKLAYHALTYFADNKTQKAYPTIKILMKLTGLARATIISSIKKLEEYKIIEANKKKGKITEYILLKLTDSKPVQNLDQFKKKRKWFIPGTGWFK